MDPTIKIILFFLLINYLLILPIYLVNPSNINFLPGKGMKGGISRKASTLSKIIKFFGDLAGFTLLFILFKSFIPLQLGIIILTIFCMASIIYQVYYHAIKRLYNKQPVSLLDYKLVILAFRIVYHGYFIYFCLTLLVTTGLSFLFYFLSSYYLGYIYQGNYHFSFPIGLAFIYALGFVPLLLKRRGITGHHNKRISYLSYIIMTDIVQSLKMKKSLEKIRNNGLENYNSITNKIKLKNQPNIFFLFIESYGKVVYDTSYKENYEQLIRQSEKELKELGWQMCSNLSKAPRMGGGSWMCYASFLYGTLIQDESFFRLIMNSEENIEANISILHALKNSGYKNYLLNPLTGFQNMQINWQEIADFFAADKIFKFSDLEYKGKLVGAIGRQPPDQFSLLQTYEKIKNGEKPFTLFFETLNSHATWESPTSIEKNWKLLNNENYDFPVSTKKFWPAMQYQINFIMDFIKRNLGENDMVVIIGDHQPPLITNSKSGYETPIHILSKNNSFINLFSEFGFEKGLWVSEKENKNVTHQGMYYILLKNLIKEYGEKESEEIPYLKNGITLQ